MKIWGLGQISSDEKNDILSKHRELYNGYRTMQPKVENNQPLFVQDFANDKGGLVVNNKGEVKPYSNMGINEQVESKEVCDECGAMQMSEAEAVCEQCGGGMNEGECSECGWKGEVGAMEESKSDLCSECGGMMEEGECSECGYKMEELDERTGHLDDIYNVKDLDLKGHFDYVQGDDNYQGSFEQMHKNLYKEESSLKASAERAVDFENPDNEDDGFEDLQVGDSEMYEQGYTGGGNAPDMDLSNIDSAYNFKTKGPKMGDGPYDRKANDMDLDDMDVWEPYDFESGGATSGGDAFPQYEAECDECWEKMESAWADEELDEANDVSGSQGIYGAMKPPYDFDSKGPGSAGPYQRSSWGGGATSSDDNSKPEFEIDSDDDTEERLEKLSKFDPKNKSWSQINDFLGTDELEHLDEDLKESVIKQQLRIIEMFNRMKVIK